MPLAVAISFLFFLSCCDIRPKSVVARSTKERPTAAEAGRPWKGDPGIATRPCSLDETPEANADPGLVSAVPGRVAAAVPGLVPLGVSPCHADPGLD